MPEILSLNALCRCCHSGGYFKSLNVPYSYLEETEVYTDMLRDTFGLLLNPPSIEASYAICDNCILQLREATKFKKQVIESEEKFETYCKNELLQQLEIKAEKVDDDNHSNHDYEWKSRSDHQIKFESVLSQNDSVIPLNNKFIVEEKTENNAPKPVCNISDEKLSETKNKRRIQFHKVQSEPGSCYICKACKGSYKDLKSFKSHILNSLCETYMCKYCGKTFTMRHSRKRHETRHTQTVDCKVCGKNCKTKSELLIHMNIHVKQTVFICDICNKEFPYRQTLRKHIAWHNGTNKKCMCDICGNSFNDKTNLNIHIRTVHEKLRLFNCTMCPKTFKAKKTLKVHVRQHTGERPYKCDTCGRGFICNNYLTRHKIIHTKINPGGRYTCKVCGELFDQRRNYNGHLRSHIGSNPHKCLICTKDFTCQFSLKRHMDSHYGIKRFECDICNRRFSGKAQLERHCKSRHNPSKVIKEKQTCNVCKMVVIDMEKHMKSHTNRTLKCDYCPKTYSERNALNRHIKQTHLGITYSCTICSKTYVKRGSLRTHELRTHKLEIKKENDKCN